MRPWRLYRSYLLSMGMAESDLANSYTSDDVSNVMGELMNQVVGDFTSKVQREPANPYRAKPAQDDPPEQAGQSERGCQPRCPEARRVTFYTGNNNIFYLEMAVDHMEFIKIKDFEAQEKPDPDLVMAQAREAQSVQAPAAAASSDTDDLLKSLGL